MAYTELSVETTVRTGLEPTYSAVDAANGNSFDNAGENVVLIVKNGSGGDLTVTISTPGTVDGVALTDKAVVVTTAEERVIGPFPNSLYGQVDADNSIDEAVLVDFSTGTTVTMAVIKYGSIGY